MAETFPKIWVPLHKIFGYLIASCENNWFKNKITHNICTWNNVLDACSMLLFQIKSYSWKWDLNGFGYSLKLVGEDGYVVTEAGFGADIGRITLIKNNN